MHLLNLVINGPKHVESFKAFANYLNMQISISLQIMNWILLIIISKICSM